MKKYEEKELLKEITSVRRWWANIPGMTKQNAQSVKRNLKRGVLSERIASKILFANGYDLVKYWIKKK